MITSEQFHAMRANGQLTRGYFNHGDRVCWLTATFPELPIGDVEHIDPYLLPQWFVRVAVQISDLTSIVGWIYGSKQWGQLLDVLPLNPTDWAMVRRAVCLYGAKQYLAIVYNTVWEDSAKRLIEWFQTAQKCHGIVPIQFEVLDPQVGLSELQDRYRLIGRQLQLCQTNGDQIHGMLGWLSTVIPHGENYKFWDDLSKTIWSTLETNTGFKAL